MPWKEESEFTKQDKAARVIQQAWKSFLVKFPPDIYYKIFTHRPIEDLCANSPRNYAKLPAKHTSHNKNDHLQEEDHSGWYHRIENNGWRPVSDTFWLSTDGMVVEDKKESEFHFSKLKRRQDLEKKRKLRKIEWMRQMYYSGSLEAKSTHHETLGLIHTATKGLIRAFEDGGIDSVMEWEVDEVLNWTNTLNFDEDTKKMEKSLVLENNAFLLYKSSSFEYSSGSYSALKWNMKNFYLLQLLLMSTPFYPNGKSEMNDSKVKLPPNTKKTNALHYIKASDRPPQKIIWYKTLR
ncbi:protein MFI isoform X7 [Homo sapiens]|uniref:protein MFI isoform X7 n=1 Tax=Homo sapiens TaxID=9606 RepID=UPI001FB14A1E|nr:protein MFI isoform X7 [Homo sapiens]XP_054223824.1 protein MFI isoform X7 [Homo sapiens]